MQHELSNKREGNEWDQHYQLASQLTVYNILDPT